MSASPIQYLFKPDPQCSVISQYITLTSSGCFVVQSNGYRVFGDCTAIMKYDFGEYRQRIWLRRQS
ncbi:MAG: hypothetical protein KGQ58_08585, partial [Proteobacteria bacterium]|nr:hypothetical protein [Pseudomonadota bacterium]